MSLSKDLTYTDQIFSDIPASELTPLTPVPTTAAMVQSGAGDATLTLPVLDGVCFKIAGAGRIDSSGNVLIFVNGQQSSIIPGLAASQVSGHTLFQFESVCVWDVPTNRFYNFVEGNNPGSLYFATIPTTCEIKIAGVNGSSDPSSVLTVTQFRAKSL